MNFSYGRSDIVRSARGGGSAPSEGEVDGGKVMCLKSYPLSHLVVVGIIVGFVGGIDGLRERGAPAAVRRPPSMMLEVSTSSPLRSSTTSEFTESESESALFFFFFFFSTLAFFAWGSSSSSVSCSESTSSSSRSSSTSISLPFSSAMAGRDGSVADQISIQIARVVKRRHSDARARNALGGLARRVAGARRAIVTRLGRRTSHDYSCDVLARVCVSATFAPELHKPDLSVGARRGKAP